MPADVDFSISAPEAPTNVQATAGDGSATVTWTAPNSDGGGPIISYTVTSNVGGFSVTVAGTQLSATIPGLTNGNAYRFRVVATNAAGDGPASALSNSVIPRGVPGAPRGVTATPGPGRATVAWTPPASNGGAAINGYTLTASSPSGNVTKTVAGGTTSTNITGLTNGVTYSITVSARNVVGTGPASSAVDVTPGGVPGAPTGVTAVAGSGSATITWVPPASTGGNPITGYTVTSNVGGFSTTVSGSENSAVINGLINGVAYRFRVFATNVVGNGPASAYSVAVTPRGVPGPPTGVAASPGNGTASVTWSAAAPNGSAITSYTVVCSCGSRTSVGGTMRSALVTGLTNGVSYSFTVIAHNQIGEGPPSAPSNAVVPTAAVSPIVFASNRPGSAGYDIYSANADLTGVVRLTTTPGADTDPSLSPDGTRIAFTGSGGTEIWTMRIDGTGLTRLTSNSFVDQTPAWSPDGASIAFASNRVGGAATEIYVMDANGTNARRLTTTTNNIEDNYPAWSPDGARIVFTSVRTGAGDLYLMNADGTNVQRLTTRAAADTAPTWSPDGSTIAFHGHVPSSGYQQIFTIGINGTGLTNISKVSASDISPAWSADGTQLVFASTRSQSPQFDLFRMRRDGTGVVRLTSDAGSDSSPDW